MPAPSSSPLTAGPGTTPVPPVAPLGRRLLAEGIGTAVLVAVVVGSGITAATLSPGNAAVALLANSTATVLGLVVLIVVLGPVSGAHLNPAVTAAAWWDGRGTGAGFPATDALAYVAAQVVGGVAGAILANTMFDLDPVQVATTARVTPGHLLAEVVAMAGLITLVLTLARTGRTALAATTVAAWIGAAYWFTSSTAFANPAVTVGRVFSDTFAGISPRSVPAFLAAQLVGLLVGLALTRLLHPAVPATLHPEGHA